MEPRIGILRDNIFLEHKTGYDHPENPSRLRSIYRMLDRDCPEGYIYISPESASIEQIELVHSPSYIDKVLKTADYLFSTLSPDTPVSSLSYKAAFYAVGGCIKIAQLLVDRKLDMGIALIRPPGHHALKDRASGFCIFNNLAITARYLINKGIKRILIIDYDVHYGNGIAQEFYTEEEVLYISTHDLRLFPYSGDWKEIGKGRGEGYTINIPLDRSTDSEILFLLYDRVLKGIFKNYRPSFVMIAAGFDAHRDDPIGRFQVDERFYGWITRLVLELKKEIPLMMVLEGGYDPTVNSLCVKEILKSLRGLNRAPEVESHPQLERYLKVLYKIHKGFGLIE